MVAAAKINAEDRRGKHNRIELFLGQERQRISPDTDIASDRPNAARRDGSSWPPSYKGWSHQHASRACDTADYFAAAMTLMA